MNYYDQVLDNINNLNENDLQFFFESNTEYIPTPYIQNHGIHFNAILTKFPISSSYICDFAYITKSTVEWEIVFIEIESPQKRIFLKNDKDIRFSSEFNNACDQVLSWKAFIGSNFEFVKNSLRTLLRPAQMYNNQVRFKYVLLLGRNSELKTQQHINMFRNRQSNDFKILTYDSISNYNVFNRLSTKHIILAKEKEQYRLKNLDTFSTNIFAYLNSSELIIDKLKIDTLRNNDFEIDKWIQGEYLTINDRYAESSMERIFSSMANNTQK